MFSAEAVARIREDRNGPVLFSVVRNEAPRLKGWLQHYRQMGIRTFAIIDNGSTDGGFEWLAAQPDVVLAQTRKSFAAANFGVDWLNAFHDQVEPGTWVLFADADELLVFRGWPQATLSDRLSEAARLGCNAVFAFMLDMYPDGPLEQAVPPEDEDLFSVAPCFDADYVFRPRPRRPWDPPGETIEVVGGPRVRLLSSLDREARTTWVDYFLRGQIDRILPHVPDRFVPTVVRAMPKQMPSLSKAPLVRAGCGFRYANNHGGSGARFASETMVFCHFKFLADFAARVRSEAARGEHYRRGAEYIMYADMIGRRRELDFRYPGTVRFRGADQLVELGLIRQLPEALRFTAASDGEPAVADSSSARPLPGKG